MQGFTIPSLVEQNEARHWSNMLKSRKELSEWTEEKLVDAVMTFAEQHGHLPSKQEYTSENGLPSYIMFCKMAEQILTESLERNFEKYFVQNNDLEQDEEKLDEEQSCGMQI